MKRVFVFISVLVLILSSSISAFAADEPVNINWIGGPAEVDVGKDLAKLQLTDEFRFADEKDTKTIMNVLGNFPSGVEKGSIFPKDDSTNWFIILEYEEVGYVKDSDKDKLNAGKLLDNIKKGTEEQNKKRKEKGIPEIHVAGWQEEPNYNEEFHSLVWCIIGEGSDGKTLNYQTKILGRYGYISATLVVPPEEFEVAKPELKKVIENLQYIEGKRYADYKPGDKVSELGLIALIAGGAGAAAKLGVFGLLAKIAVVSWKFILIGIIAIGAFISKLFGFKKKNKDIIGLPETYGETAAARNDTPAVRNSSDNFEPFKPVYDYNREDEEDQPVRQEEKKFYSDSFDSGSAIDINEQYYEYQDQHSTKEDEPPDIDKEFKE